MAFPRVSKFSRVGRLPPGGMDDILGALARSTRGKILALSLRWRTDSQDHMDRMRRRR